MIKLPAEVSSGLPAPLKAEKNQPLTPPINNFLIVLALRSSLAGRRHNLLSRGMEIYEPDRRVF
jgi:hypothetical protein